MSPTHTDEGGAGGVLRRLREWRARHFVIVLGWLVALVALQTLNRSFGGECSDQFALPGVQSRQGLDVLKKHDPAAGGCSNRIVLHDGQQSLTTSSSQMSTAVGDVQKPPHVLSAQNPLSAPASKVGPLASDGRTGYIAVRFDVQPSTLGDNYLSGVDKAVQPLRSAGSQVEYGELGRPAADDRMSELIGFAVAIVVLLIGFGSVIAAGLPLFTHWSAPSARWRSSDCSRRRSRSRPSRRPWRP